MVNFYTTKIDSLVKLLGTMVMEPQYESDPATIGSKKFAGNIQVPIIKSEENRKLIEDVIMHLVKEVKHK